ncbi:hypothetical protein [Nocardia transvalensis]|uniref:hypothetical protein n=1 Tax=Nocardia transvalensis TaxID=37333 RepID=UPI00189466EE|nr:hypothetical protein [Nocardia transvalensis]MBF6332303.1 hypothetical protein [Nocardia transvalensis]
MTSTETSPATQDTTLKSVDPATGEVIAIHPVADPYGGADNISDGPSNHTCRLRAADHYAVHDCPVQLVESRFCPAERPLPSAIRHRDRER